jgi:hypothetical protein
MRHDEAEDMGFGIYQQRRDEQKMEELLHPFKREKEPVCAMCKNTHGNRSLMRWVGLTDEDLEAAFPAIATYHETNKTLYRSIARAIEAKLKEKNT